MVTKECRACPDAIPWFQQLSVFLLGFAGGEFKIKYMLEREYDRIKTRNVQMR